MEYVGHMFHPNKLKIQKLKVENHLTNAPTIEC
jgi:hypothetical protein